MSADSSQDAVSAAAHAARAAAPSLAAAPAKTIDEALRGMARRLVTARDAILAANREDQARPSPTA